MALVNQIWKDKAKGEVNPLAFSELAQKWAQKIDIEGRSILTKEEQYQLKKKIKNKQERELAEEQIRIKKAEKMVQELSYQEWLQKKFNWKEELNKSTQIRKFYNVIFDLNQRQQTESKSSKSQNSQQSLDIKILAQLHRQLALVHYAKGRNLVTASFVSMMDELIKAVESPKDLQVVTDFLEAFMAYYKELRGNN